RARIIRNAASLAIDRGDQSAKGVADFGRKIRLARDEGEAPMRGPHVVQAAVDRASRCEVFASDFVALRNGEASRRRGLEKQHGIVTRELVLPLRAHRLEKGFVTLGPITAAVRRAAIAQKDLTGTSARFVEALQVVLHRKDGALHGAAFVLGLDAG